MKYAFYFVIILLPFSDLPLFKDLLREVAEEGAFYPLLGINIVFIVLWLLNIKSQKIDYISKLYFIYIIVIIIGYFVNYNEITTFSYLDKNGQTRYLLQLSALLFGFISVFSVSAIMIRMRSLENFLIINKFVVKFVVVFGLYEYISKVIGGGVYDIYSVIYSYISNSGSNEDLNNFYRIRSVTQEPSHLSMYLSVMGPFYLLISILRKEYFGLMLFFVVYYLTFSRIGYFIIFIQFLCFSYFKYYKYVTMSRLINSSIIIFIVGFVLLRFVLGDVIFSLYDSDNTSNIARYAASYSAYMVWLKNNIYFGVGLGMVGFYSVKYLPAWGLMSGEVYEIINGEIWPTAHNMLIRLLAESGLIGVSIFLYILIYLIKNVYLKIKSSYSFEKKSDYFGYSVFVSMIGVVFIMFNRENLTNMNIWVGMGIALFYINKKDCYNEFITAVNKKHDVFA